MTTSWVTQISREPRLIGVGIESTARTHTLIVEGGVFSLSLLPRSERELVRHFVKPLTAPEICLDASGSGTLRGVPVRQGSTGAPVLDSAASWVECELRHQWHLGSHTFFAGEVMAAGFGPEGQEVPVLRMEDTRMHYGG
jgi:flavin reductase (DIM6/NTAB) family NADH-FMN oxidoreductase RutF